MIYHAKKPPRSKPKARKPVRKSNAARKRREFARAYHSAERVEWVKALPCVACGVVGFSENAHVASGGAGRKADASQIVPLCSHDTPYGSYGCHRSLHNLGHKTFELRKDVDLDAAAENTERLWQLRSAESATPKSPAVGNPEAVAAATERAWQAHNGHTLEQLPSRDLFTGGI